MDKPNVDERVPEREKSILVQSWLAEYQALNNESLNIDRFGNTLISVNIVAVGIVLTIWRILADPSFYTLLFLAMSFASSCLGLIWVAGQRDIIKASNHIGNMIAPSIRHISKSTEIFKWEEARRSPFKFLELLTGARRQPLILIIMFFGPSITSFGIAFYQMSSRNLWSPWFYIAFLVITGILILLFIFNGWRWFKEWKA